ncbi:MAG: hypothetical protein K940chlam8_00546 [Chlamydiae bacterium]|nr:hypothetical protein [Chlamydiota bacterium]
MATPPIKKNASEINNGEQLVRYPSHKQTSVFDGIAQCLQGSFGFVPGRREDGVPPPHEKRWYSSVYTSVSISRGQELSECTDIVAFRKRHTEMNKDHANLRMQLIYLIFKVVHLQRAFFRPQETRLQYGVPQFSATFASEIGKLEACHVCPVFLSDNRKLMDRVDDLVKEIVRNSGLLTNDCKQVLLECDVLQEDVEKFELWLAFQSGHLESVLKRCTQNPAAKTDAVVKRDVQLALVMLFGSAEMKEGVYVLEKGSLFELFVQVFALNAEETTTLREEKNKKIILGKNSRLFDTIFGNKIPSVKMDPRVIRMLAELIERRPFSDNNERFVKTLLSVLGVQDVWVQLICEQWKNRKSAHLPLDEEVVRERLHQLPTGAGLIAPETRLYQFLGSTTMLLGEVNRSVDPIFDRLREDLIPVINDVSFGRVTPEVAFEKVSRQVIGAYERNIRGWQEETKKLGVQVALHQALLEEKLNAEVIANCLVQLIEFGDIEVVGHLLDAIFYHPPLFRIEQVEREQYWTKSEKLKPATGCARALMIALKRQFPKEALLLKLEESDILQRDQGDLLPVFKELLRQSTFKQRLLALIEMNHYQYLGPIRRVLKQKAVPTTSGDRETLFQDYASRIQYAQEQIEGMKISVEELQKHLVHQDPVQIRNDLLQRLPLVYYIGKI